MTTQAETTEPVTPAEPEEWAIVEIMGHLRRAGRIMEVDRFGSRLLRVDVPLVAAAEGDPTYASEFFSGGSIYRLRPCTEEIARAAAQQIGDPRPVLPVTHRLAAPAYDDIDDYDDERPF